MIDNCSESNKSITNSGIKLQRKTGVVCAATPVDATRQPDRESWGPDRIRIDSEVVGCVEVWSAGQWWDGCLVECCIWLCASDNDHYVQLNVNVMLSTYRIKYL